MKTNIKILTFFQLLLTYENVFYNDQFHYHWKNNTFYCIYEYEFIYFDIVKTVSVLTFGLIELCASENTPQ